MISDDDRELFKRAMSGVKPLKNKDKIDLKQKKPATRSPRKAAEPPSKPPLPFHDTMPNDIQAEETLEFKRQGLRDKQWRQLKKGQFTPEMVLDLHGQTVDEARESLSQFLHDARERNCRHIRIIHGKGQAGKAAKLKSYLNMWLPQCDFVLAYCSCIARHGGAGAIYVILKSH